MFVMTRVSWAEYLYYLNRECYNGALFDKVRVFKCWGIRILEDIYNEIYISTNIYILFCSNEIILWLKNIKCVCGICLEVKIKS